jgi:hypothetical protein
MVSTSSATSVRYCLDCGYRLDNLPSTRCPECGRVFDLTDAATTSARGRLNVISRWAASTGPARWLVPASVLVALVVIFLNVVWVGAVMLPMLFLYFAIALIAIFYLPRRIVFRIIIHRHRLSRSMLGVDRRRIWRCRAIILVAAVLVILSIPHQLAFSASKAALRRVAIYEYDVRPAVDSRPTNTFVGVYRVRAIRCLHGTTFELAFHSEISYVDDPEGMIHPVPVREFWRFTSPTPDDIKEFFLPTLHR